MCIANSLVLDWTVWNEREIPWLVGGGGKNESLRLRVPWSVIVVTMQCISRTEPSALVAYITSDCYHHTIVVVGRRQWTQRMTDLQTHRLTDWLTCEWLSACSYLWNEVQVIVEEREIFPLSKGLLIVRLVYSITNQEEICNYSSWSSLFRLFLCFYITCHNHIILIRLIDARLVQIVIFFIVGWIMVILRIRME